MGWSKDEVEKLKLHYVDKGKSAGEIEKQNVLPGKSRNAIIGKLHRLGISREQTDAQKTRHARQARARQFNAPRPKAPRPAVPVKLAGFQQDVNDKPQSAGDSEMLAALKRDAQMPPPATAKPLLRTLDGGRVEQNADLDSNACRFIYGKPSATEACFCAKTTVPGTPWCSDHLRLCTQVTPPRTGRQMIMPGAKPRRRFKVSTFEMAGDDA